MEHKNDDTFANFRLLGDTASFLSSMEKLAPLHPSVQFILGVPLGHDGGPLFMMPKRERSRRRIPKIQRKRNTTNNTTIGGGVTSLLSDLQASGAPSDYNLLIKKKIYASDINPKLGRLSIPCKQVEAHDFLTTEEEQMLMQEGNKGITVSLFLPSLNITQEMSFRCWNMRPSSIYVICGSWSHILKQNIFNEGDNIRLYYYRNDSKRLCLVLFKDN